MSQMLIKSVNNKKRTNKCIVEFENDEILELSVDLIVKYTLKKGSLLDDEKLKMIISEQKVFDVKQAAFSYASYKPRTVRQVLEKLRMKEFSDSEIAVGINFLTNFNLLDDEKFSKTFAYEYSKRKNAGKQKVFMELLKRGIHKDLAKSAVAEQNDVEIEFEMAMKAAEKKLRQLERKPPEKRKNSLIAYLQRQGFNWDTIRKVLENKL